MRHRQLSSCWEGFGGFYHCRSLGKAHNFILNYTIPHDHLRCIPQLGILISDSSAVWLAAPSAELSARNAEMQITELLAGGTAAEIQQPLNPEKSFFSLGILTRVGT